MNEIYIMVPLASIASCSVPTIEKNIAELLHLDRRDFEMHEIIRKGEKISQQKGRIKQFCVKIENFDLTFLQMDCIMKEYQEQQKKIQIIEEALENYNQENRLCSSSIQNLSQSVHLDQLIKKAKKAKQLKEENKKLKKLLQVQLENTEKVREETQKTMKNLKQQFDALVTQMTHKDNLEKGGKSARHPHTNKDH